MSDLLGELAHINQDVLLAAAPSVSPGVWDPGWSVRVLRDSEAVWLTHEGRFVLVLHRQVIPGLVAALIEAYYGTGEEDRPGPFSAGS